MFSGAILLLFLMVGAAQGADHDTWNQQWPQWRGPLATGVSPSAQPPTVWSEEEGVRWKVPLASKAHASPIAWGERLFLTHAIPFGETSPPVPQTAPGAHDNVPVTRRHRFAVTAYDRHDGRKLWTTVVREALPHEGGHDTASLASASPITNGAIVWAHFGSYGLYALDPSDGTLLWSRDFGRMETKHAHGEGASPALWGDTLVVNWDHRGPSFIEALDAGTGETRWRRERDEGTSWATPLIVEARGRAQVVTSATRAIRGYDLETGDLLWSASGLPDNVVASPVSADGVLVTGASYDFQAMLAIQLSEASGSLAPDDPAILWKTNRLTPYVPSPAVYQNQLFYLRHLQNILTVRHPQSGEETSGPFRLPGLRMIFASPVIADDRLYIVDRSGATLVMQVGPEIEPLALNRLDDRFSASPALVGDTLYLRGEQFLYALGTEEKIRSPEPTEGAP